MSRFLRKKRKEASPAPVEDAAQQDGGRKPAFLHRLRRPRKRWIALGAVVIAAALAFALWPRRDEPQQRTVTRTVTLSRGALEEAVSVTGTVESTGVTNVTTTQTGAVTEIYVTAGSSVTEGQALCELDSEDLQEQLQKARETYSDNVTAAQENYDKAVENRTAAYDSSVAAESAVTTSKAALDTANARFETAKASIATYQSAYDAALLAEQSAGAALNNANAALAADPENAELAAAQTAAQAAYDAAKIALASGTTELESAKATCGYAELEQALSAAQQTYDSARSTLTQLENAYTSADDAVETAEKSLQTAKEATDEIESLQDKIDDCAVTATASGTVTTVNAVVGSAASTGTPLFVIQNTDSIKVAISVDEDDVTNLSTGMSARITSDVTGDEVIDGTLSTLSMTATNGGFSAEVTVDDAGSGLLIGTNAKVEIVLSAVEDVWSVPIDAVETDEDGNSVIYVKEGDDFVPVEVTTGAETDYYIEITGDALEDGMEVRASADADAAEMTVDEDSAGFAMGGMGGMTEMSGGGDMPSGGDMPGGGGRGDMGGGPMGG